MNWKTIALCSAMAGLAMMGCNSPTTVTTTDGGTHPTVDAGPTTTRTYVLSALDSGENLDQTQAYGFNLDNMVDGPTGSCADQPDFMSPAGYPTMTGVDNQLGTALGLVATLAMAGSANDLLNGQVRKGSILLIIQVTAHDFANDTDVTVHTSLATLPNTAACTAHADMASCSGDTANTCNWYMATGATTGACSPLMLDATGAITAGQTFTAGMDLGTVSGTITNHTLTAVASMLPLSFSISGMDIALSLNNLHITGVLGDSAITSGEFGASLAVADLIRVAQMTSFGMGMSDAALLALLAGAGVNPDLDPHMRPDGVDAGMGAPTDACASISAGFGFSAVTGTVH